MNRPLIKSRWQLPMLGVALLACAALTPLWAAPIPATREGGDLAASPLLDPPEPPSLLDAPRPAGSTGSEALEALRMGRWTQACRTATEVLARHVPDVEALGIFGLCAAVTRDRDAANTARTRLAEAERTPYFGPLTQGVLLLGERQPEKAQAAWRPVLQARRNDPLALYFEGEALHARRQTPKALAAFRGVLNTWPEFTPAMTAIARLNSGPKATPQDLKEALSLAERATEIEPTNRGYWRLLADLCRRTGQVGRADAIALQHLRQLTLPALR
jgi:tetratricopeptide (TPR) repeat protein